MMARPKGPHILTLIAMTACTTVTLNLFMPSLPGIAAEFGVPYGTATLSIGGYLAMTAVVALVVGPVSDRVGRRPVAIFAAGFYAAASLGCALAPDWGVFLACRLAQAVMVSGYVLANAVVRDTREKEEAATVLGYILSAMAIAPILAPIAGGFLYDTFGWRANFVLYAGMGVVLLVLVLVDLEETRQDSGSDRPKAKTLLSEPVFWAYALTIGFSTCCFYAFVAAVPLVAETSFGLTGFELGIGLGSITVGFMTGSFVTARLIRRFGMNPPMLAGRVVACGGLAGGLVAQLWFAPGSPLALFGATIFIGIGNGLTMPPANAGAMSVRPEFAGTASGIVGSMTVALGAVAATLAGVVAAYSATPAALLAVLLGLAFFSLGTALYAARSH